MCSALVGFLRKIVSLVHGYGQEFNIISLRMQHAQECKLNAIWSAV